MTAPPKSISGSSPAICWGRAGNSHKGLMMFDLVIRNGTIVDGSGGPSRVGDVAVRDGWIVAVGQVGGAAEREIDATGLMVTPGFVDLHTHYDGQIIWSD